ncbi:MAG TPA: UDP-glucose 4-epimerase GalE [Candidatus Nanoarchaeia archaeon]|nr:UDP-glucose 4-epimerase GalE [Candidatus Nanoarchaeia archaeon]
MKVLVTGGAGYIGSHAVRELIKNNHQVIVYDNLCNGYKQSLPNDVCFIKGDLADQILLNDIFKQYNFDTVLDFAGHLEVGESMRDPSKFYTNNVIGLSNLLNTMKNFDVKNIIYSSSASVYGVPKQTPIPEHFPHNASNVYGETKSIAERMLKFFDQIYGIKSTCLRYFNAAGADAAGDIGEAHKPETHLIPLVFEVVLGKRQHLTIYGDDYTTQDGTCIRDFIHVSDLAQAHILTMENLFEQKESSIYNVGTGSGYSVREIIGQAREITGHPIPILESERRLGDPPELVADVTKIKSELGWTPKMSDLDAILRTAWNWHKNHPNGY